jgi:hypothetical protein
MDGRRAEKNHMESRIKVVDNGAEAPNHQT